MLGIPDEQHLLKWIEDSIKNNKHVLAAGYQGRTLLYKDQTHSLVIKIPHGSGLSGYIHKRLLRHEYRIYQKLAQYKWAPSCYGLINNTYLALQYIDAGSIRDKRPGDEAVFFRTLLQAIKELHSVGIAHMDLKRKDNLLVTNDNQPCIIDFGTAITRKQGVRPVNHFIFNIACRFDLNAWIKHKYHNNMDNISNEDMKYYKRTSLEKLSSKVKHLYTGAIKWLKN